MPMATVAIANATLVEAPFAVHAPFRPTKMQTPSVWLQQHLAKEPVSVNRSSSGTMWDQLNGMIASGHGGTYTGGKGVLVRALLDGVSSTVVPATFIVNDIVVPSTVYPSSGGGGGNPECPCDSGSSGYNPGPSCQAGWDGERGPWNFAQIGAVVGSAMSKMMYNFDQIQDTDWGWGVFYPSDSNSADQRCRWLQDDNGYDCPGGWIPNGGSFMSDGSKKGSGNYPAGNPYANPAWGGGTGCHFASYQPAIDQTDANDNQGNNIVQDYDCQCNYNLKGNGWEQWVDQWMNYATAKPGFGWQGWFSGKAPSFALDFAACWLNNPRDMIQLQNALWYKRYEWSNELLPSSSWNSNDAPSLRPYWGWNEAPVAGNLMDDPSNWDAIFIKLPAAICGGHDKDSVTCLKNGAQQQLESDLDLYVSNNILKPGWANAHKRPGSAVVFLNEEGYHGQHGYQFKRRFACEGWTSPNNKYKIVESSGVCYLDWA
jgi:hypothetical protein